jgi:hypothetical protein
VVHGFARFYPDYIFKKWECLGSPLALQCTCDAAAIWSSFFSPFGVAGASPVPRRWNGDDKDVIKPLVQLARAPPIYWQCWTKLQSKTANISAMP